jgi:hypothetical protein
MLALDLTPPVEEIGPISDYCSHLGSPPRTIDRWGKPIAAPESRKRSVVERLADAGFPVPLAIELQWRAEMLGIDLVKIFSEGA